MINIKTEKEIVLMKKSAELLAATMKKVKSNLKPGVTAKFLSQEAENYILAHGGIPAFKGYMGYPETLCVSINGVVIHGIPLESVVIKNDDLISVDAGVILEGFFSDAAFTVCMKKAPKEAKKLAEISEKSLYKAIKKFKKGGRVSDISNQIQVVAERAGYSVVKDFVGHGIGRNLHEDPQIPNFGAPGHGALLKPGMVFAIEVMINQGSSNVEILNDGWTVVTKDGKLSAHFEHTVCLTERGPVILTKGI